jgi:tRNA threonylcarbamoyladenosine biosynthesis protein TsaB
MISLFIDTALSFIRIALFKDNFLIDFINEECEKNMSSLFDVRVMELFKRNNLSLNSVNKIYTVTGPGSFTGIRVGMTFSKVLAMSLNIKITPISELQVLASTRVDSSFVAPVIDARRGYVYAGVYDKDLNIVVKDKYILLEDFLNTNNDVEYISYDSFERISPIVPNIDFERIINKNKDKKQIDHQVLTPNYLKLTEAEENLRKKKENDN